MKSVKSKRNQDRLDHERFVIGNWKCTKSSDEVVNWFEKFADEYQSIAGCAVVVAPPLLYLEKAAETIQKLKLTDVYLAAQDISPFPRGNYTGATAADMVKLFADYVIVGHTERRKYFHETSQDVNNKVLEAIDTGLIPLVCVDKPYAMSQLAILNEVDSQRLLIGYTPVDPLSSRIPESPEKVAEYAAFVRGFFPGYPIVYGGSVDQNNSAVYSSIDGIVGLFVGSASLDSSTFARICNDVGKREK